MDAKFKLNRPTRRICDVKHKNGILLRSNEPTQMWSAVVCAGHESAFGTKRTSHPRRRMSAFGGMRTRREWPSLRWESHGAAGIYQNCLWPSGHLAHCCVCTASRRATTYRGTRCGRDGLEFVDGCFCHPPPRTRLDHGRNYRCRLSLGGGKLQACERSRLNSCDETS